MPVSFMLWSKCKPCCVSTIEGSDAFVKKKIKCVIPSLYSFMFRASTRRLPKATYNKYICRKKEKQQYIAVSTVRMFMETNCNKHLQLLD